MSDTIKSRAEALAGRLGVFGDSHQIYDHETEEDRVISAVDLIEAALRDEQVAAIKASAEIAFLVSFSGGNAVLSRRIEKAILSLKPDDAQ